MLSTIAEVIRDLLIFVGVIAALLAGPHFFRALYGRRMDQLEQSAEAGTDRSLLSARGPH